MSKAPVLSFLVLAFLAFPALAQSGAVASQCTPVTNSAGVSFQACAPDDGAAADIGPAQGLDADSIQVGAMCMAKAGGATYSVICPAGAGLGSGCSCQDPNTGETVAGRVAKVGQYTN